MTNGFLKRTNNTQFQSPTIPSTSFSTSQLTAQRQEWTLSIGSPLRKIDHQALTIEKTPDPAQLPDVTKVPFGENFSDHILQLNFDSESGWSTPQILPLRNVSISPAAPVLQYGLACFEGMKAFSGEDGLTRLFRPTLNMARFNKSASRLLLPNFDEEDLLRCIEKLIKVDERWIPRGRGQSLYIRPTLIATATKLGVSPSTTSKLFVLTSPCGHYFRSGFKAIQLYATEDLVRAWPGGAGDCKVGGNYAPTLQASAIAAQYDCAQVLWLLNGQVQEAGTSNIFFVIKSEHDEQRELVTPPLTGTILPGIVRQSCLDLARHWGDLRVSERSISIAEVRDLCLSERILECFCTGTAAGVAPVFGFCLEGERLTLPLDPRDPASQIGPYAKRFYDTLLDIYSGSSVDYPHTIDGKWTRIISSE